MFVRASQVASLTGSRGGSHLPQLRPLGASLPALIFPTCPTIPDQPCNLYLPIKSGTLAPCLRHLLVHIFYWRGWAAKFANVCQPQQFLGTYLHNYQGNPSLAKLPANTTGGQRSGRTRGCGCFTKVTPGCGCRPPHTRLLFPLTQSCGCEDTQRCGCPRTRRCSCTPALRWNNNTMFTLDAMHTLL